MVKQINPYPKSRADILFKIYEKMERKIEKHFQFTSYAHPCVKGCSKCCNDFFLISDVEFDLILIELHKWSDQQIESLAKKAVNQWQFIKEKHPKFYKFIRTENIKDADFYTKFFQLNPNKVKLPCLFLDETTSACMIYSNRPKICRHHGTGFIKKSNQFLSLLRFILRWDKVCEFIGSDFRAKKWQADLSEFEIDFVFLQYYKLSDRLVFMRPYPMLYFVYEAFCKNKTALSFSNDGNNVLISEKEYKRLLAKKLK